MVSALTIFELDEMMAAYASYEKLAECIRHRFAHSTASLHELFARMVFNILCGNTDDHARNHSAFWDGHQLALTPAYDICPQSRTGQQASQAMLIHGSDRRSQIATCMAAAPCFGSGFVLAKAVLEPVCFSERAEQRPCPRWRLRSNSHSHIQTAANQAAIHVQSPADRRVQTKTSTCFGHIQTRLARANLTARFECPHP